MSRLPPAGTGIQVSPGRLLPLWVTGTFFAVGLAAFAIIPVLLWGARGALASAAVRHWEIVTIVHFYAVGWALAVALGAWQQLAVVAFKAEASPYTPLAGASLILYLPGFLLFWIGFARVIPSALAWGGGLLVLAFGAMTWATLGVLRSGKRRSLMVFFALPALICLVAVAAVGIVLAVNMMTGRFAGHWLELFRSHLYLGPVGWFGMLVPGVSYELGPFFGITRAGSEKGRGRLFKLVAALLGGGLLLGLAGALSGRFHPLMLAPLALGYLLFCIDLRGIYGPRPAFRRTPVLTGVRFGHAYLAALALVLLAVAAGAPLFADQRWIATFGWLAAAGWLANTVAAYLHRILPFLLWHHRYWGKPKEEIKTPFAAMVDPKLGRAGFAVYNAGVLLVAAGFWAPAMVSAGVAAVALGTWMLVFNLGRAYLR